ncbi:hypothetical protein B9Z55_007425 [Caenorhabditis nigoni]|uniref:BTB domain-containing protein n=2 Tax=Caenorhabditis nigoni TaxID=1611254 RepID=A0A2G5V9L0_9PELO|nr:hypothetical protein B9Z55_007425 [Caenorhabditis nigoni]
MGRLGMIGINTMAEKEFTLTYEFQNVGELGDRQNLDSPKEEHFGMEWKMSIDHRDGHLKVFLNTDVTENQEIHFDCTTKIFSKNKERTHSESDTRVFTKYGCWMHCTKIDWKTLNDEYLNDGKLEVEVHVKIRKNVLFPREPLRSFGEDTKQFSDITLKVADRRFYVSKLYLSSQSPYFATLFLGQFRESEKSEIELKDVNPQDLQYFLEFLYAEGGICEYTVQGILAIADMYDTPVAIKKCEEFLIDKSKLSLKHKLELAGKYRLEELKKVCLDKIESKEDIRSVVPENVDEMDPKILGELFKKTLTLI